MSGGGENDKERLNRELIELLTELRVALPGVQVLFAFLLIDRGAEVLARFGAGAQPAMVPPLRGRYAPFGSR